jgi:hypothetical protein
VTGSLTYLYAVVPAAVTAPQLPGVDAEAPRALVEGRLTAVVGSVAAQRFDEEGIAHDLEDLRRLEVLARAHHGVVAALAEDGPVAPVRLATIFRDDDGVRTLLRERAEELTTLLERLGTCREWGVKVWATGSPAPPEPAATPATTTNGSPGTAYLMRRRAEREAGSRQHAHGTALTDRLHAELSGIALAEHRLALQDASLSGRREEMLLNATYLVRREDEDAFRSTAGADGDEGIDVVCTGPWPPFSFSTVAGP